MIADLRLLYEKEAYFNYNFGMDTSISLYMNGFISKEEYDESKHNLIEKFKIDLKEISDWYFECIKPLRDY